MRAEFTAKIAWLAMGIFIAIMARNLGIGSLDEPGPGMLAFGLGIIMAVAAAAGAAGLVTKGALKRRPPGSAPLQWKPVLRMASLCIGLLVYIAVLDPVGYPLATFAFMLALLAVFGRQGWMRATIIAAAASGVSYALFKFALGTQLPAGLLG